MLHGAGPSAMVGYDPPFICRGGSKRQRFTNQEKSGGTVWNNWFGGSRQNGHGTGSCLEGARFGRKADC